MDETGLALSPSVAPWIAACLILALGAVCVLAYRRTTRPLEPRAKRLLVGLRLGAVALAGLCLFRPSLEVVHHEVSRRPLLLLVDRSDSMTMIKDTPSGVSRFAAVEQLLREHADELTALAEVYDVRRYDFARGLLTGAGGTDGGAGGETRYSAYGLALEQAALEAAGGRADAVVVFGDGSQNYGPPDPVDVAARLGEQGIPVVTVGVGQDMAVSTMRDVRVVEVTAPRRAPVFARFPVRGTVLCRGCEGREVTLDLLFPGQQVQKVTAHVSHSEETLPVEFEVTPEQEGEYRIELRAEPVQGELVGTNNSASAFVKVRREGVVAGYFDTVRPEAKFLQRAVEGAQQLQMQSALVLPGQEAPQRESDMERYDVIVLGDVPPSAFAPSRVLQIRRQVQERGKGLVVLLGEEAWAGGGWGATPVADLLPVAMHGPLRRQAGARSVLPTAEQADNPMLALGEGRADARTVWREMPPLDSVFAGPRPKAGALVLLADQDGLPVLVAQRSGLGRVLCVLTDSTFRWFFTQSATQDYYRRFWRQALLWAAGGEEQVGQGVRLELSRQQTLVGEPIQVQVTVTGPDGTPAPDVELSVRVAEPGGRETALRATYSREAGAFVAQYVPQAAGEYSMVAEATRDGAPLGRDRSLFAVTADSPELAEPIADVRSLRRMAAATQDAGGRYFSYLQVGDLFRWLRESGRPLSLATRSRRDVWDVWPVFAVLAALVTTELALRKWRGLV